jgi:hypothetical protein
MCESSVLLTRTQTSNIQYTQHYSPNYNTLHYTTLLYTMKYKWRGAYGETFHRNDPWSYPDRNLRYEDLHANHHTQPIREVTSRSYLSVTPALSSWNSLSLWANITYILSLVYIFSFSRHWPISPCLCIVVLQLRLKDYEYFFAELCWN